MFLILSIIDETVDHVRFNITSKSQDVSVKPADSGVGTVYVPALVMLLTLYSVKLEWPPLQAIWIYGLEVS